MVNTFTRKNTQRWNSYALLNAVERLGEIAPRPGTADVSPMRQTHGKAQQRLIAKNRPDQFNVGEMIAPDLWMIEHPAVARLQSGGGHDLQELFDGVSHHPEMHRDVLSLCD